jgi:hypothetical protein
MTVGLFALAGLAVLWTLVIALRGRRHVAGVRIVTCPETGRPAAVSFDVGHATLAALVDDEPRLKLADCSRWPVRGPCDQACLPQAEAPASTATNIAARWSAGKRCVFCGGALVEAPSVGHHVAVRSSDGMTTEWPDFAPEDLMEALRTRMPVCWNCHVAETFRRQHPELITDRCFSVSHLLDAHLADLSSSLPAPDRSSSMPVDV